MTQNELIEQIHEQTKYPKCHIENIINVMKLLVHDTVSAGDEVKFKGLGTFFPLKRKQRIGHNPQNMESVLVPAKTVLGFRKSRYNGIDSI